MSHLKVATLVGKTTTMG